MKTENKSRRSARIPANHNIMLMVDGAAGETVSKEVLTTMRISRHGAQLLGRRPLSQNSKGKVAHLSTCRQAPFRIAWQAPSAEKPGFHEIGIEFEESADFWGPHFEESKNTLPASAAAIAREPERPVNSANSTSTEILDHLRMIPSTPDGREVTDAIWCRLIEQLEERRVISRSELIASLRKIG